ncbi:MAG: hypothetical protein EXX96DRAFT_533989 [Benjaminiella poitrasii]|nr:MAG: hypothetical protein EXX96DRAFT_533989 [Benjaminiella poitrasii]
MRYEHASHQEIGENSNAQVPVNKPESSPTVSFSVSLSSTTSRKAKGLKYCSLAFKVIGLFIIIGIVLVVAFLPNYIRNKNLENSNVNNATDPTNARLPGKR